MRNGRITWIDRMKVIGMYFIIAGHLFPIGYKYIYAFSVSLFFLISGFLHKRESSHLVFWKKILFNYVIPVFCIRTIMYFWERLIYTGSDIFLNLFEYWTFMLKGYQNCIGACWFIYTLILIRILFQYLPYTKAHFLLFILFTCTAIYLNKQNIHRNNAILNLTVAYQPYAIGYLIKRFKSQFDAYQPSLLTIVISLIISISLLFLCGKYNGNVWLYNNDYGCSIFLYIISTLCGASFVFHLSKINKIYNKNIILTLSIGNIVTLGFHQIFINLIRIYLPPLPYLSYLLAVLILLSFYPITRLCQVYCPFVLGNFHSSKEKK